MSLDTYANLKLEILDWSQRDDIDPKIDTFIDIAETEMYANQIERLKLRGEEKTATASTSTTDRYLALPTNFLEMRRMKLNLDDYHYSLRYFAPLSLELSATVGTPNSYTINNQIEFNCISDQAYTVEMMYFEKPTPLSSSNTTNTILTNYPTIYFYGAMWAMKTWAEQPQAADMYYQKFVSAIAGANMQDQDGRYGPAPVMRIDGTVP